MNSSSGQDAQRIPWGSLLWTLPLGYVFFDPWQQGAAPIEWLLTGLALSANLALYLLGLTCVADQRVTRLVCGAILSIAVTFVAYRPSGAIYFPLAAAFAPFTVRGGVPVSAALITAIVAAFGLEWWLLTPTAGALYPSIMAVEIVLIGAGTTIAARNTRENHRSQRMAERERIARDLHDVLGQTLSSIALKAELARRLLDVDPPRARAEIEEVERISRDALDEVRQAIDGYYAGDIRCELDRVGAMLAAAGVQVEQRCDALEVDPVHERVLALILREAVTNVVRHAKARICRLALIRDDAAYRLEISDDGCGGQHQEGIGMRSIRARIEALGGTATWTTQGSTRGSHSGTRLAVILPLASGPLRT